MPKNYVQPGNVVTVLAPVGGVSSGDPVLVGSLFGLAVYGAVEGKDVEIATAGVFTLPKATGTAWSVGDPLYWDASAKKLTKTAGDNLHVAIAAAIAASGDTTGAAKLIEPKLTGLAAPQAAITDLVAITGGKAPTAAENNAVIGKVNAILAALRGANVIAE